MCEWIKADEQEPPKDEELLVYVPDLRMTIVAKREGGMWFEPCGCREYFIAGTEWLRIPSRANGYARLPAGPREWGTVKIRPSD